MTWSVPIWLDLWLVGMAGGSYATAFLVAYFSVGGNKPLLKLATFLSLPLVVIGVLLLVIDLGNPLRFWHFLTQFKVLSPMSMGTWIVLAWIVIAVMMVILWRIESRCTREITGRPRRITGFLSWFNLVLAVLLMVYGGVLPAVSSKMLWSGTFLLPALFVASDISMGLAILIIVALTINAISQGNYTAFKTTLNQIISLTNWTFPKQTVSRIALANAIVILVEVAALTGHIFGIATYVKTGARPTIDLLIAGRLAVPFWLGVGLLALLMPLVLYGINWRKDIEIGTARRILAISSVCVIFGGLLLRAVIMAGGQMI